MTPLPSGFRECPNGCGYHNQRRCPICNDHSTDNPRTPAKLEQDTRHGPLAAGAAQTPATGRVHIRFESVRKRLLDPDNLSEKWTLDCLRYIGAVDGDEPDKITLETTQRKAAKGEEEHTEVTITYPCQP